MALPPHVQHGGALPAWVSEPSLLFPNQKGSYDLCLHLQHPAQLKHRLMCNMRLWDEGMNERTNSLPWWKTRQKELVEGCFRPVPLTHGLQRPQGMVILGRLG